MELQLIVGRNVRRLREERGLPQETLAHQARMHVTYLSGLENGRRNVTLAVVERLAKALKVPEAVLLERRPSAPPSDG